MNHLDRYYKNRNKEQLLFLKNSYIKNSYWYNYFDNLIKMKFEIREGQIYQDVNDVQMEVILVDEENNLIEKEALNLFTAGFTHYEMETDLEKFKELLKRKKVWLVE